MALELDLALEVVLGSSEELELLLDDTLELVEDTKVVELVVLAAELEVVVGALVEEVVAALVVEEALTEVLLAAEPMGNTTMLAVTPLGTVTTQKLAPPAPFASSSAVTPPMPSVDGSMEHGRPLQTAPSGHSNLTPKFGIVVAKSLAIQIGFHPIFA